MALPSQLTQASQLGEIHRSPEMVASAATSNQRPNLGSGATSHLGGGAGWWKSPSLALARGRDGIACHVSGELRAARQQEGAGRQAPGLLQTRFSLINYVIEQN
jgi:hypothetical protein